LAAAIVIAPVLIAGAAAFVILKTDVGNSGSESVSELPGDSLTLRADPNGAPKYETGYVVSVKAGTLDVNFINDSFIRHDVVFEDMGDVIGRSKVIAGSSDRLSVELEPGNYEFYCSIADHADVGMSVFLIAND